MKRVVRVGVAHHLLERHPFCDSPINIVVCLIAIPPLSDAAYYTTKILRMGASALIVCQFAALVTVRQPIFNRPSTATPTIFQSPSNHHPHAPRPSLLPSAATRQDILFPPQPRRDIWQPSPNTEKAGGPKPARRKRGTPPISPLTQRRCRGSYCFRPSE